MNLLYLIRDLWQRKNLQEWVNCRFKDHRAVVLDTTEIAQVVLNNGLRFYMGPDIHSASSVYWRYNLHDIKRDDIVLDLGANVGGYSLAASQRTDNHVYAVEPVLYDWLIANIVLNDKFSQIKSIDAAIGSPQGRNIHITWRNMTRHTRVAELDKLIDNTDCNVMKMDIEGAEWKIDPECLYGLRMIEGQLHYDSKQHMRSRPPLVRFLENNYNVWWQPAHPPKDRPCLPQYVHAPLSPLFHAIIRDW